MAQNNLFTVDMITSKAVKLFKNSNMFIMNLPLQCEAEIAKPLLVALTAKEVAVLGAAAIIAKNPVVTRRFFKWR